MLTVGFEPTTASLPWRNSTPEPCQLNIIVEYCKFLNFSFSPFKDHLDAISFLKLNHSGHAYGNVTTIDYSSINSYFLEILSTLNLDIGHSESFHKLPSKTSIVPHIDIEPSDICKINWVYLGQDSTMNWFNLLPNKQLTKRTNLIGKNFYSAELSDVYLSHSVNLQGPALVQVGELHNITNTKEERFCASFCIVNKVTRKRMTFKEASKILSEFII